MDRQQALRAYAMAILPEREAYLREQALRKVRPITRGMKPDELDDYLGSKAFSSTLYRVRQADKVYKALERGELVLDYHQAEFERLAPLIASELEHGHDVDLPFLRSVDRSRVSIKRARAALRQLDNRVPRRRLEAQQARFAAGGGREGREMALQGQPFAARRP